MTHETSLRPARRENLPATIAGELRRRILRRDFEPGQQLPGHRELAVMYSVSVGTVREAISMLISAGLVETRAGKGTFVAEGEPAQALGSAVRWSLEPKEVVELVEAREVIESELAAMAAHRASVEQIEALRTAVGRMDVASANPDTYPEADVEFHLALAEAADNRYLLRAMLDIRTLLRKDMELGAEAAIRRFGDLRVSVESHRHLVDAIEAHDAERARHTAASIVRRNRDFVLGLYGMALPAGPGG